jgi:hypothetical protein
MEGLLQNVNRITKLVLDLYRSARSVITVETSHDIIISVAPRVFVASALSPFLCVDRCRYAFAGTVADSLHLASSFFC